MKAQLRQLRQHLGHAGDLQLTDGEVTLRPEPDLIELIRYANELGLVPMLMTHGDSFRRQPGLLERLVEAGLREVSFHVDATMRGRSGFGYRGATRESELEPLRKEFAELIRKARHSGRPLDCATTATIASDNLDEVPGVLKTLLGVADAFKMISFQSAAQVGRTRPGLGGAVSTPELWKRIAAGLGTSPGELERSQMWLGHSECSRFVHGLVLHQPDSAPRFYPLWREGVRLEEDVVTGYLSRFGGTSFRRDGAFERRARALALLLRAPRFWLGTIVRYGWSLAGRMAGGGGRLRLLARLATGRARVHHFIVVSHHFMSRAETETALGQERLHHCVFRVPIGEQMVAMCEVNALGVRERLYRNLERLGRSNLPHGYVEVDPDPEYLETQRALERECSERQPPLGF